ncbi:MAG: type 1 glutamine amidotransferase domain-containing protein [Flavobacteriaceae bacterium]
MVLLLYQFNFRVKDIIMSKKVLIVVANPSTHPTLNYPVGFWASELFHPIEQFDLKGLEWEITSPEGGEVLLDPMSNPNDPSGYSSWDELSKKYVEDPEFMSQLKSTPAIGSLDLNAYDAILVAGGQSPMFTFEEAVDLQKAVLYFYNNKKIVAALCHGVAVLNFVKDEQGRYIVRGRKVTGFTNEEEDQADAQMKTQVMPWRIEDELNKKGAHFHKSAAWEPFAMVDDLLITGQQNMSGEVTAKKVIELLKG